jgi:hypothetical protein
MEDEFRTFEESVNKEFKRLKSVLETRRKEILSEGAKIMDAKINQVSPLLYDVWLWWPHERSCPVKDVVGGIGTLSGTWGVRDAIAELRLLPSVVYGPGVCVCVCYRVKYTSVSCHSPSLPPDPPSLSRFWGKGSDRVKSLFRRSVHICCV